MGRLVWEKSTPRTSLPSSRNKDRAIMQTLAESFGHAKEWPAAAVQIGKPHVPTLRALASARGDPTFEELADLIGQHGTIRVWAQE